MRPLLTLILLAASSLATSARAQPVVPLAPAGLGPSFASSTGPSPAGRAAAGALLGTTGAFVGGGSAALGVLAVAYVIGDCSPFGCAGPVPDLSAPLVVAFTAGGAVGSAVMIGLTSSGAAGWRSREPLELFAPGAWRRALAGAALGSVPGLLVVALVGPSEGGVEWVAVPIAQGIGTGIALSL